MRQIFQLAQPKKRAFQINSNYLFTTIIDWVINSARCYQDRKNIFLGRERSWSKRKINSNPVFSSRHLHLITEDRRQKNQLWMEIVIRTIPVIQGVGHNSKSMCKACVPRLIAGTKIHPTRSQARKLNKSKMMREVYLIQ